MWSRKELKENAKVSLKANYWKAFFASLIVAILGGGFAASRRSMTDDELVQELKTSFGQQSVEDMAAIIAGLATIVFVACIISFIITIFLKNPLLIGSQKLLLNCKDSTASARDILFAFKNSYGNIVLISFVKDLCIFLWSLLLVFPGIIKAYEYRMVNFLIAENPDISRKEAFAKSKEMMKGNKWKAFIFDLSFLGWHILGLITFGIAELFYVLPYHLLADTELYYKLK